jgi:hypothetical protein
VIEIEFSFATGIGGAAENNSVIRLYGPGKM